MAEEEKQKKAEKQLNCVCFVHLLEALGKFGVGLAAVIAVFKAPGVAKDIYKIQLAQNQKQTQNTTIIVGSKKVKQDFERIAEKIEAEPPKVILDSIPAKPFEKAGTLQGVYILPEYRDAAIKEMEHADTRVRKEQIIKDYFKRSLELSNGSSTLELNH